MKTFTIEIDDHVAAAIEAWARRSSKTAEQAVGQLVASYFGRTKSLRRHGDVRSWPEE